MRRLSVFVRAALGVSLLACGCSRNLVGQDAAPAGADGDVHSDAPIEANPDRSVACYPLFHACVTTDECCAPNRCLNITGTLACQQEGPAIEDARSDIGAPDGIPRADPDAGTCSSLPGVSLGVICFGSDPTPYQLYLTPADGSISPGQCPSMSDFVWGGGESCGYAGCGPLLSSAVSELADAGAVVGDAGTGCCFLVSLVCGV